MKLFDTFKDTFVKLQITNINDCHKKHLKTTQLIKTNINADNTQMNDYQQQMLIPWTKN